MKVKWLRPTIALLLFLLALQIVGTFQFIVPSPSYLNGRSQTKRMASGSKSPQLTLSLITHLGEHGQIRLILASQSPRRREILDMMGLKESYEVIPSTLDETELQRRLRGKDGTKRLDPIEYTKTLATEKARALAEEIASDATKSTLVIGSDTTVDIDNNILEKPKDEVEAKRMLFQLSGKSHYVHTGVAIYSIFPGQSAKLVSSFVNTATVKFASVGEPDLDAYIATKEPMDKAGSYGIQGIGGQFVERIEGDFFTVMGLPMHRTSIELAAAISDTI